MEKIHVPLQIDLPGVGEKVQEHCIGQLSWGEHDLPIEPDTDTLPSAAELKDDVKFDTLDLLRDPVIAAKHLELQ